MKRVNEKKITEQFIILFRNRMFEINIWVLGSFRVNLLIFCYVCINIHVRCTSSITTMTTTTTNNSYEWTKLKTRYQLIEGSVVVSHHKIYSIIFNRFKVFGPKSLNRECEWRLTNH